MNTNPERNQQNTNKYEEMKDHLFSRIEIEWGKNRNDNIVDQLAAEHTELANDLYEFFAHLIELELNDKEGNGVEDDEDQAADEKMKNWLETEGLEIAMTAAVAECKTTTTTTTPPLMPDPPTPDAVKLQHPNKVATESTVSDSVKIKKTSLGKVVPFETFARKMRKKHDWGLKDTSNAIEVPEEFILFAQSNQEKKYDPVRDVITDFYIEKKGGDRGEIRESFNQSLGMVASTGTPIMKQSNYEEMVAKAKITKSKKKFWLDLVSGENEQKK